MESSPEKLIFLAKLLKKKGEYQEAISIYEKLKKLYPTEKKKYQREIFILNEASKWVANPKKGVEVQLVQGNTVGSDFATSLLGDQLVITSDRPESTGDGTYTWTGKKHMDLWLKSILNGTLIKMPPSINTPANEGSAVFSQDGMEMVFTRCTPTNTQDGLCKLYYSKMQMGTWSEPVVLPFCKEETVNYGQPAFVEGDTVLIFVSNKPDGYGGYDLYYSVREFSNAGFEWSIPEIMPPTINTQGNEMFPTGNGDTLYYSSDYLPGLGGLDIFMTYLDHSGKWTPPQNLQAPVNSSFDDFSLLRYDSHRQRSLLEEGYFSSSRPGVGKEDIYHYTVKEIKKDTSKNNHPTDKLEATIYLAGITKSTSGEKLQNVDITLISNGETLRLQSDKDGKVITPLRPNATYDIKVRKKGYFALNDTTSTGNLHIPDGQLAFTIHKKWILEPIITQKEINLENIYYDLDKWDIRPEAYPTLDKLAKLLNDNPSLKIQLSSHTDCRSDDEYNLILSQKRAESVVLYLSKKGIHLSRLSAKGYGESNPAIPCECSKCTEQQHQANRRTTFKIISY